VVYTVYNDLIYEMERVSNMSMKRERIPVFEMTCTSCEARVERAVSKLAGVTYARASYSGQYVDIEYNSSVCSIVNIQNAVKAAGYSTTKGSSDYKIMGIIIIALAIILLGKSTQGFDMNEMLNGASYLVLFIVGLLTSIHCVGMCGGIMLSQTVNKESPNTALSKFEAIKPALLYNSGRVLSYTILGGIIGAVGSVLSMTTYMQAWVQLFAAVFMIVMGLNMFGVKAFRKFHVRLPWSVCSIKNKGKAPLLVGLLNGFMPCGPLQTMQLYALSTGSPLQGAMSMFVFAIGTVPLMLIFGAVSGLLSKGYTKQLLKFSGIFVIILGLIMGRRGLALAGVNVPNPMSALGGRAVSRNGSVGVAVIQDGVQIVNMTADGRGYTPNVLYVQKGIPVKWVIDGKQVTSCNNAVVIPALKERYTIRAGENIAEFTPDKTGDLTFSCWMGMIPGVFKVVDDLNTVDASKDTTSLPAASGGCCGAGGGTAVPSTPSIYGDDLSNVPADRLVKKAVIAGTTQSLNIKGIGYEFDPLIIVVNKNIKTKLSFDLKAFENPAGRFTVIDGASGDAVASFNGSNSIVNFEFTFDRPGGYGILKNNQIYGIIEVLDDINLAEIEAVRDKYLN
jgi:sulfite exporter TauE/SafE/plastocyanin domain-containing protein/copper chaperone CopZ